MGYGCVLKETVNKLMANFEIRESKFGNRNNLTIILSTSPSQSPRGLRHELSSLAQTL
jgi:hypothetical protein